MIEKYLNKIICADSLEIMQSLPDKCVDLVLTDPPYGINIGQTVGGKSLSSPKVYKSFDDSRPPGRVYFDEIKRISKNAIIFGGNYFMEHLESGPCWIVWDKDNSGNFADCELAWTNFKTAVRKIKFRWNGMLQQDMKNKGERHHPTQKPVGVFTWILRNYGESGMTILDPFGGSGTTAIAALKTNMNYIVIEKEQDYVDIANKRVREYKLLNTNKLIL